MSFENFSCWPPSIKVCVIHSTPNFLNHFSYHQFDNTLRANITRVISTFLSLPTIVTSSLEIILIKVHLSNPNQKAPVHQVPTSSHDSRPINFIFNLVAPPSVFVMLLTSRLVAVGLALLFGVYNLLNADMLLFQNFSTIVWPKTPLLSAVTI